MTARGAEAHLRVRARTWFWRGARQVATLPAVVLLAAQVGFAALAREAGYDVVETVLITVTVWALPAQVVFVGIVGSGASLPAVALAVALSSVRFMPMLMAWTPMVRGTRTSRWRLLAASWFVAVTSWVFAMSRLPALERDARLPYFVGFGTALMLANVVLVALSHTLLGAVPALVGAALVFLTPNYFLMALWGAARLDADRWALGFGLVLGPVASTFVPELDLLVAGVVGGTLAYVTARLLRRRSSP